VWLLVAVVLSAGERSIGVKRALALYLVGALAGHGIGHVWQPYGAGCSVAGCGVLGALAVWLVRARLVQVQIGAAFWLGAGVVATALRDIHGPPLLAGALAGLFLVRSVPLPRALG
jgi:rhomboid protease GluP